VQLEQHQLKTLIAWALICNVFHTKEIEGKRSQGSIDNIIGEEASSKNIDKAFID